MVLLGLFFLVIRKTWIGRALRGSAQNRVGIQTAGVDVLRLDMIAFGVGVALAAAAGALLAPDFLVYPENGSISTFKGFEIIVIGGLGSILGSIVGGVLLGLIEALGSVFISAAYKDLYGFLLLIALLVVPADRPLRRARTHRLARGPRRAHAAGVTAPSAARSTCARSRSPGLSYVLASPPRCGLALLSTPRVQLSGAASQLDPSRPPACVPRRRTSRVLDPRA